MRSCRWYYSCCLAVLVSVSVTACQIVPITDRSKTVSSSNENNKLARTPLTITQASSTRTAGEPDGPSLYYIAPNGSDSADGSAAHPWVTIQHAADSVGAGVTVHVAPGNYPGAIVSRTSGTAAARIRFVSDTRWGAKIRTTGAYTTWENRGDYVDIVGFDVTGDGYLGILNLASYVRLIGNHVHDIPAPGCASNGGAGINNGDYSAHDSDIIGNVVHDIGDVSQVCNRVHGIYHSNLRGRIWNNISFRNQGWGIHTWHAPVDVVISNNLVFENGEGGIVVGAGDSSGGVTADGFIVSNNIVIYNNAYGIMEFGQTGTNNRYLNNLVYGHINRGFQLQNGNVDSGTLTVDPRLVNYQPDGSGDYHPSSASPAIDAGTSIGAPQEDIEEVARPQGAALDIGPFERKP